MKTFKVLLILGPTGAGKTELAGNIFRSGQLRGKCAYVFNDDGTSDTVDAAVIAGHADFRPMNSGCFGCTDEADFLKVVSELRSRDEYAWLIIEPLGFIDGNEVPRVLRKINIEPDVISLLDAAHLKQNDSLGMQSGHLASATLGVGITKYPANITEIDDPGLEDMLQYIGKHAPGQYVFLLPKGGHLPTEVVSRFEERRFTPLATSLECTCGHDQSRAKHHGHEHGHHDHGFFTYSFRIRPESTYQNIRKCFDAASLSIVRVKGVIQRQQFHMVHGTWERTIADPSPSFVTFYTTKKIDLSFLDPIRLHQASNIVETGKAELRKQHDGLSSDELVSLLLKELPVEVVIGHDGPVTNPEKHELLNEIRNRPDVSPALNRLAIQARVSYYFKVIDALLLHPEWCTNPTSARKQRDLAVGIGWFACHRSVELGQGIMAKIDRKVLASFLSSGLLDMTSHNSDAEKALAFANDVRDVVRFISEDLEMPESLTSAIRHVRKLAKQSTEKVQQVWQSIKI